MTSKPATTQVVYIRKETVKAGYAPDPGDWFVEGVRLGDDYPIFLISATDKETAHNLAASLDDLQEALKADEAVIPFPIPRYEFV